MSDWSPSADSTIIAMVAAVLGWLLVTGLSMWAVWSAACHSKRAKSAIKKDFPYFVYPFYKKMFFMGLKGALSKINLVFIWANFIFVLLFVCVGIIWLSRAEYIPLWMLWMSGFLSYVTLGFRLLILRLSWPDFKQANIKKK